MVHKASWVIILDSAAGLHLFLPSCQEDPFPLQITVSEKRKAAMMREE